MAKSQKILSKTIKMRNIVKDKVCRDKKGPSVVNAMGVKIIAFGHKV